MSIFSKVGSALVPIVRTAASALRACSASPVFQALSILAQPEAQRFALIHRLAFAQHLPSNRASEADKQNGEHDFDPLSRGGMMSQELAETEKTCG